RKHSAIFGGRICRGEEDAIRPLDRHQRLTNHQRGGAVIGEIVVIVARFAHRSSPFGMAGRNDLRSEEHTSELQSREKFTCRRPPPAYEVSPLSLHAALPISANALRSSAAAYVAGKRTPSGPSTGISGSRITNAAGPSSAR